MTGTLPEPDLLVRVQACRACTDLPLGPRPILQWSPHARILIAGQAPGRITHERGRPFDDASGERLRGWLGLSPDRFYDDRRVAIVPMAFCFPGSGKGGDAPPPPICAALWRDALLAPLSTLRLIIVIGRHAADWHLPGRGSLTARIRDDAAHGSRHVLLPHPSPRNNRWLVRNPWFEAERLPKLRLHVADILGTPG
ncbi:MAG: uracil-DNA glycosylase family protein [Sphingopyxis sp.]|uniref:uracil-DNA glycosylase family protein n=1 Tax=Sphingopyxis sp. TaxID=1908224 RepID=UPI002AB82CBC|nr:uracil-DNA glycosylase family protein [Sphingopyxis sp.]MDZ3830779.1 uracil-DNA glycosylase family protein [Sphingopyxis sp.]